jgi:hypothetical protein
MARGRPKKRVRNIVGLRNQAKCTPASPDIIESSASLAEETRSDAPDDEDNITVPYDGLKISFEEEYLNMTDTDTSDIDEEVELDILDDEEFGRKLAEMVEREDGKGADWIPERLRRQRKCECS